MKIPNTGNKKALIVVDAQPAFVKPGMEYIVPAILTLINSVTYDFYIEATFFAEKKSLWDIQKHWILPKNEKTKTIYDLEKILTKFEPQKIEKSTRAALAGDSTTVAKLEERGVKEVHIVGTETNDCVLATAYDAFDKGFLPFIIEECSASATPDSHKLGLKILQIQNMTNNSCLFDTKNVELQEN